MPRLSALFEELKEWPPLYVTLQIGLGVKYDGQETKEEEVVAGNAAIDAFIGAFGLGEFKNV